MARSCTDRRTWAISVAKVLSDATWWLMLFWMPDFFHRHIRSRRHRARPAARDRLYRRGDRLAGLPARSRQRLLARGWSVNRDPQDDDAGLRRCCVLPVSLVAADVNSYPLVVGLLALALAGHQGFSTSLFALIADVTPHEKVGRVTAFGAFCGNIGGVAISKIAGLVLTAGLGYAPLFAFASVSYLLALGWIQLLLGRIRPVSTSTKAGPIPAH